MDFGIAGRKALVAASSAGLGLGSAKALAEAGCDVVISGRNRDRIDAAVAATPGSVGVLGDVSTVEGATSLVDDAVAALGGPLDILVTNAGGPPPGTFATTDLADYPDALALNLLSVVAMCHAAVPGMQERGWGRVVAITSVSVRQPIAEILLSNTARAGVTGFLKTLATEVAPDGVTVNSVQPGLHATDRMTELYGDEAVAGLGAGVPVGFIGDPDDFGAAVAFFCSEQAKFITGTALPVDGGTNKALQ